MNPKFTLYEITEEILERLQDVETNNLNSVDNQQSTIDNQQSIDHAASLNLELDEWNAALDKKLEGCCKVVMNLNAHEEALRKESQRFAQRATTTANRVRWLKDYMKRCLDRLGMTKMNAGLFDLRIQKSPLSVDIKDEGLVPEEYRLRVELVFDKQAIGRHIQATGEIPPGVEAKQGTHLRIK